ncbi:aminoglycoside phosphotransferase family protein [Bacillus rhizoplanae]|uniref:aminoglycoside phosphotransferase family protein n=1 Tax=Bacillus rhizoplanae TaxID=2880966 RepID=UPI003D1F483B
MNEVIKQLAEHINWSAIVRTTFIPKGFSFDEKWRIELETGKVYFIKICDIKLLHHKQEEFQLMKHFESKGVPVPTPIHFVELHGLEKCVQVFEWIEGEDGEEALGKLTLQEQYENGKKAGEVLKRIHTLQKQEAKESWEEYRWAKYERYIAELTKYGIEDIDLESVITYVEDHKYLLKDRPNLFIHDDFHPANLMFQDKKLRAVIDFDRFEWGDPYHDFYKVALFTRKISEPFAIGQVHGYFEGEPPIHFWKLYTLYAAMIFPSDIVWSYKVTPDCVDIMKERLNMIIDDHNGFTSYIPNWYKSKGFQS